MITNSTSTGKMTRAKKIDTTRQIFGTVLTILTESSSPETSTTFQWAHQIGWLNLKVARELQRTSKKKAV